MNLELQKGSRSKILAYVLFGAMFIFVVRLFQLQIIQHNYYVGIADKEQIKRLNIPAKRGLIYTLDQGNPVPLVMNQTVYTVFADPKMIKDKDAIIDALSDVAKENTKSNIDSLLDMTESRYQVIATKITRSQADELKSKKLYGVGFQEETQRVYPEGVLAAQTLGFVDYSGVGRYGVEGYFNDELTGVDGMLQSVTDVSSVPLTIGDKNIKKPAVDGKNIVLSLDRNIQSYVEQALKSGIDKSGADSGSVVMMDPQTGRVLSMANYPSYEPAKFNEVDDISKFNNPVVSSPYEPGSNIKTLTMAVGIDRGVVSPYSTYINYDYIKVDDRIIRNAVYGHTGEITFQHAMNWSLNTGFVTVVQRLGGGETINRQSRDIMYDYFYNKFKLGQKTGIEVSGEVSGTLISPELTEGNAVRYANMAFGQGMDLTMIQVAAAFSSIVNGGKYYTPTVISGYIDDGGKYVENPIKDPVQNINKATADQVREMAYSGRSSNFPWIDKSGYYVGGKTGTSQVAKNGVYSDNETVGTYLGFGGSEELSRYVIMVQVSGEGKSFGGAGDAMPIFTDISNWMLDYLKIQPKE